MSAATPERRRRLEAVSDASADADVLVTIAVPAGDPIGETLERAEEAHAEAEYLDDGSPRPLRKAYERAVHVLHGYDGTPENGLVVYVGVVDGDLAEFVFDDLPGPVREARFDHGNTFDTEPLEGVARPDATYGLLVVERGGAALGRLRGDRVEVVETVESRVPGKTRKGGQSADRFERDRERAKREFFEAVADEAERAFLGGGAAAVDEADGDGTDGTDGDEAGGVDGLLLGGTTVTVEEFRDGGFLDRRLADRLVGGTFGVEYASEQGLRQLVERASDALADDRASRERDALDRFFRAIDGDGDVVYGREETADALAYGAVETLLVSDALPADELREFERRAEDEGGEVVVVSTAFEDGERFGEAFGGVGALLRFPVE